VQKSVSGLQFNVDSLMMDCAILIQDLSVPWRRACLLAVPCSKAKNCEAYCMVSSNKAVIDRFNLFQCCTFGLVVLTLLT